MIKNRIYRLLIRIFNIFPIKKNKIFMTSYYGAQYGCNPKYISNYLLENEKEKFDLVWAFNNLNSDNNISGIRRVKYMSPKYFYELCTSKVIITNFRYTDLFIKRKSQYYIQTWHSSLRLKKIEKDAENNLPLNYIKMAKDDSKKCDLLLSGCKYSSEIFRKSFWYNGEIMENGTPRNDIFFNKNHNANYIKDTLNINENKKIILYAPTFRKDNNLNIYEFNYLSIIESAEKRFGGEWVFLVKLHPHLANISSKLSCIKNVIDVSKHNDIQELLLISDILISDYSSLIFDFSLTEKPTFLYTPDLLEYMKNDRKLYFDIRKLPFKYSLNEEDLNNDIKNFNENEYIKKLKQFSKQIGSFENGNSCKEVVKKINEVCFG